MQGVAARPQSSRPTLVELPEPAPPAPGQVLCRTVELGVCGTDREILRSEDPLTPTGAEFLVLGHECLARIEQLGDGVDELSAGDWVVPFVRRPLEAHAERVDMLAFGRYTERGIVREHGFSTPLFLDEAQHLMPVPAELAEVAVFTEPMSVAEKGANEALLIQQARLGASTWQQPPPRVLVAGMGPIGFAALLASVVRGWPVTMYGRDEADSFRAQLARSLGADYRRDTEFMNPPGDVEQDGFDLILECTGNDEVVVRLGNWLATCGIMVWLGSARLDSVRSHNMDLLVRNGMLRNHLYVGSVNAARRDFADAVAHLGELLQKHPEELPKLITARVDLRESLSHFEERVPQAIKSVIAYG